MIAELWGTTKEDIRTGVPSGFENRFDELIDKGSSPTEALNQVNIESEEKERKEREISDYENRLPSEWRERYRELLARGLSPENAYNTVMNEIKEQKEKAEEVTEEVEEKIKELPEEIRVPTERAIGMRITMYEKEVARPVPREKFERMTKALGRQVEKEMKEGDWGYG